MHIYVLETDRREEYTTCLQANEFLGHRDNLGIFEIKNMGNFFRKLVCTFSFFQKYLAFSYL